MHGAAGGMKMNVSNVCPHSAIMMKGPAKPAYRSCYTPFFLNKFKFPLVEQIQTHT